MGREIVGNDMNGSPLRLRGDDVSEEVDKGGTRVVRHGLPEDFTRLRVERRKQRQRAVPVVLEAMALGAPRRQRQHGIETIERLNGGFLIDGEHRRVVRRIDVQPDHVGGLGFDVWIVDRRSCEVSRTGSRT